MGQKPKSIWNPDLAFQKHELSEVRDMSNQIREKIDISPTGK